MPMVIAPGDKVHIITRKLIESDLRRHFAGVVEEVSAAIARIRGYAFVYDEWSQEFLRGPGERTRVFSLLDAGYIINIIPITTDIDELKYKTSEDGRRVITDGKNFTAGCNRVQCQALKIDSPSYPGGRMKITSDWHIHSRNSCDSACMVIADLVREAEEKGICDFGVTDHVHTPYNLGDIARSQEEFLSTAPSPRFHFGVEVSCVSQWELDEIASGTYLTLSTVCAPAGKRAAIWR